jgi:hypothetical protein
VADQRATLTSVCFGASGSPTHPKSLAEDAVSESGDADETGVCARVSEWAGACARVRMREGV